jgi:hypothetical protein
MTKTWRLIAEAMGIETEAPLNFQKLNRRRQMQQYGTTDRRDKGDPMMLHRMRKQQAAAQAAGPADMTGRPGGLSDIPSGTDRPGQGNPLVAPPRREPMQARRPSGLAALVGADDEED